MFAITGITGKVVERSRATFCRNQPVRAVVRDLRKGETLGTAWLRPRACGYQ